MKKLMLALMAITFCVVFAPQAQAASPVFFTALQTSNSLDYSEIYNSASGVPINMNGWRVEVILADATNPTAIFNCSIELNGWLRPENYGIVAAEGAVTGDSNALLYASAGCIPGSFGLPYVAKVVLKDPKQNIVDQLSLSAQHAGQPWVRRYISSTSSNYKNTGVFDDDFLLSNSTTRRPALLSGGWYDGPPDSLTGLEIKEILPKARHCSPLNLDLTCGDYIKLYNSSSYDINLADYRLRVGYQGQTPGISNTFTWGQEIDPATDELILPAGSYFTLTTRNDGLPLSVPDGGDFVWLEDAYGQKIYSPVVEYPSATSTTKTGYAWAFNNVDWQWTSTPQPAGSNYFFLPEAAKKSTDNHTLKPCRADQFRNPLTNRCKKKSSAGSTLKPCRQDQFRNPATNRCKSKTSAANSLKPCRADQFRNPATNRCKKLDSVSSLKPCKPGQKRNPLTNRCRKVGQVAGSAVQEIQETSEEAGVSWWLAGAAGVGAIGYGVYEWRSEIVAATNRLWQLVKAKR